MYNKNYAIYLYPDTVTTVFSLVINNLKLMCDIISSGSGWLVPSLYYCAPFIVIIIK